MIEHKKNLDKFKINERYETEEYIGSGSTGIVYKGRDLLLNKTVAIKILKTELAKNEKFISSLSEELKDVFNLEHKNIVEFYEIIQEKDKYFVVMEYVDCISLQALIVQKNSFNLKFSTEVIYQISEALDYSSKKNIFHKALKPQNILIGANNQIKITDFGFAKAVATAWLTLTGTSPTQVEYMSPEQAEGENADQRTDIYSLGIIAYHLLTGDLPFKREGSSILSVAMKHINSKPESLTLKNPDIPIWLENIILKCLEKSPKLRFQNGQELSLAIRQRDQVTKEFMRKVISEKELVDDKETIEDEDLFKAINEGFSYKSDLNPYSTMILNDLGFEFKNSVSQSNKKISDTEIILNKNTNESINSYFNEDPDKNITYQDLKEAMENSQKANIDMLPSHQDKNIINRFLIILLFFLILVISALVIYIIYAK